MQAINASTGRFFTKFGGMIASGVQGIHAVFINHVSTLLKEINLILKALNNLFKSNDVNF